MNAPATAWGPVAVGAVIVLVGVAIIGTLVYADRTSSVTRAEYDTYIQECDDLESGPTPLGMGGAGEGTQTPGGDDDCRNTTYAEYQEQQRTSMLAAPLHPFQWVWFGATGLAFVGFGWLILSSHLGDGQQSLGHRV